MEMEIQSPPAMRKLLLLSLLALPLSATVVNEPSSFDLYGKVFSNDCLIPFSRASTAGIAHSDACPSSVATINLGTNAMQGFFHATAENGGQVEARFDFYAIYRAIGGPAFSPVTLTWPNAFQCQGSFVRCEWTFSIVNGSPLPMGTPASVEVLYADYVRMDVSLRVALDPGPGASSYARLDYDFTQYTSSDGLATFQPVPEPATYLMIGGALLVARFRRAICRSVRATHPEA
jgi:hypothetical protein